jgi:hypothetical protein
MAALLAEDAPWTLIATSQRADIIAQFQRHIRLDDNRLSGNKNEGGL